MALLFTAPDEWAGGSYEMALEYRSGSLRLGHGALAALWSDPKVGDCYLRRDVEPEDQLAVDAASVAPLTSLYGKCILANVAVAAHSQLIAYDHGPVWLYFGFPMASLGRAYPVGGYPFSEGPSLKWRDEVDAWLRDVASQVFQKAPFDCALICHEPEENVADELAQGIIPARRWEGILVPKDGQLAWFPPTEGAPYTFDK